MLVNCAPKYILLTLLAAIIETTVTLICEKYLSKTYYKF